MTQFTAAVQLDSFECLSEIRLCEWWERMNMKQLTVPKWALVPGKLSSQMISLIVNAELIQELFIGHCIINVYGL